MKSAYKTYCKWIGILFIFSFFFYGMYYEFCGAIVGAMLGVTLLVLLLATGKIHFRLSLGMSLCLVFLAGYALTALWAVDFGMALLGFFKVLWICLFLMCWQQMKMPEREKMWKLIPYAAGVMTLLGMVGNYFPQLYNRMYANGRLGGGFQYPNTFALFLLLGMILLCNQRKMEKKDYVLTLILLLGLGMSGSRIGFVLTAVVLLGLTVKNRNKVLLLGLVLVGIALAVYVVITGDTYSMGRITTFSLTDSALVGRILYAKDALGLLLKHPFGMGHGGYYYMENLVQTGVYSVRFVHNDWLQIGLDMGWIPLLLYPLAVVAALRSKKVSGTQKIMLAVIFVHGLLEFDLAFGAILCVVFLIMDQVEWKPSGYYQRMTKGRLTAIHFGKWIGAAGLLVAVGLCIYIAIPLVAYYNGDGEMAVKLYSWYTEAKLELLSKEEDAETVDRLADEILAQNDTCALACYGKAMVAYCQEDYEGVIRYQRQAIERDAFNYEEYLNYAVMLKEGMTYYEDRDEELYQLCRQEIAGIPELMEQAKNRVGRLGSMINDQPELSIDAELYGILHLAE